MDDFKPLTQREQALVAGWEAEVARLREQLAERERYITFLIGQAGKRASDG